MTFRLKDVFEPRIKTEKLDRVFSEIDMPLIPVTATMEDAGIKLDVKLLNQLSAEAEITINELVSQIHKLSGVEFNVASPKQMKEVLFDRLKLSSFGNRRTKTGLSTAAGELEKMIDLHPVIAKILEYRELAKLQSTYLEALPEMVSKQTGRIHTNYNQTIAATGRLSSTDPNLQNIPVRGEGLGSKVRQAFVAKPGYELLSMDYSQIELRIAAHVSKDEKMLQVFTAGEDIHTKTAVEVFGVKPEDVTKDMRRDAKAVNFGVLYGLSSYGLQGQVQNMSRAEAGDFINRYFTAYPKVEQFLEQVKLQVREEGFVRSETGRIRRFPEIHSSQFAIRAAAERAAINFPIQSLSADIIKIAMVNIFKEIGGDHPDIQMLLQVHDELVFEVKEGHVEAWAKKLKVLMENAYPLAVPVVVEAKAGKNWGDMKELVH
jgi:DNA polymerase-1